MKSIVRGVLLILILIFATSALMASGLLGIYAIVSKVVMEPNDKTPERIQIWGAFTFVDGGIGSVGKTLTPKRGYLYFMLPSAGENANLREVALKEWADFKAIAGTGQALAFGHLRYMGPFSDAMITRPPRMAPDFPTVGNAIILDISRRGLPIREESLVPSEPDSYPLNMGLTKLSATGNLSDVVRQLQESLKPHSPR